MKILVTGINGLLGKDVAAELLKYEDNQVFGIGRADCLMKGVDYTKLDITDFNMLTDYLHKNSIEAIVHCAAITKPDQCEKEPELAYKTNVEATGVLADHGCRMIYMSSDAVFSGTKGDYKEDDTPDPLNLYGELKAKGETVTLKNKNGVVLRSSIYGYNTNSNVSIAQWGIANIRKHHPMRGFNDVIINPLYSKQIAEIMAKLLKNDYCGVLNIGCLEKVSKYDFFCTIARKMGIEPNFIESCSIDVMGFDVPRCKNTTLDVSRLKEVLGKEYSFDKGVEQFLKDYLKKQ